MAQRILIVDDEAHILQVLSLKLGNVGFDVVKACDGEEAFELARQSPPDLVITDYQMPYMTGLELCIALKNEPTTAHVPVIMLTARGYALSDDDLKVGNIRDVQSKPFSPRAIAEQVRRVLDGASGRSPDEQAHSSEAA